MKKFLVGSLLGIALTPSLAFVAHAQVQTQNPCDVDTITCLKAQILILQELIVLIQQLNELVAQQSQQVSQQSQQINQIQNTVNSIQQNTTPPPPVGATQPPIPAVAISAYTVGTWGVDVNYHGIDPTLVKYREPFQSDDFNFFIKPAIENPTGPMKIHISTDNPDGFQRKNWHPGDTNLTTDDTFDYSGNGDNDNIGAMAYRVGVWHYTLSVVDHPETTLVITTTVILPKP